MRARPVPSPQQASAKYGTNGGSANAATDWAAGFTSNIPAILAAAKAAIPFWQQQVSTQQAAANMGAGLDRASNNTAVIAAKVNGVGKASFSAGVRAASTGNYMTFATQFLPVLATEVANLDRTNPRGDASANTARMNAYNAWALTQTGKFRVK